MRTQRRILSATAVVALLAALAACGSSGGSQAAGTGKLSSSVTADLNSAIAKYESVPGWTAPGPPVNVAALAGKCVFVIPEIPNAFNNELNTVMTQIAKKAKQAHDLRQPGAGQPVGAGHE